MTLFQPISTFSKEDTTSSLQFFKLFCKKCWFRKQEQHKLILEERLIHFLNQTSSQHQIRVKKKRKQINKHNQGTSFWGKAGAGIFLAGFAAVTWTTLKVRLRSSPQPQTQIHFLPLLYSSVTENIFMCVIL